MKKYTAQYFVETLDMQRHPEGGWYKETYRSDEQVKAEGLPESFTGARSFSTGIYFLLQYPRFSAFHRIKSDEMWHFYAGAALNVYIIDLEGEFSVIRLGADAEQGERFQAVVRAGCWFASQPAFDDTQEGHENLFSLVGCTVSPGFDFEDFEMAKMDELLEAYPEHERIIRKYCRS